MKKYHLRTLLILSALLLSACSQGDSGRTVSENSQPAAKDITAVFETVCSAEDALALSRENGAVVFEYSGITSGREIWDTFYQAVMRGEPASVLCAYYLEQINAVTYEENAGQYPKLFYYLISFDGASYTARVRACTYELSETREEAFAYLLHLTGDAPSPAARYSSYDYYVLVDDPAVTMEEIWEGMVSSQFGAAIRHLSVYIDYIGWKSE